MCTTASNSQADVSKTAAKRTFLLFGLVARALEGDLGLVDATEARRAMMVGLGHDARFIHVKISIVAEVHATIVAEPPYMMLGADLVGPVVAPLLEAGRGSSVAPPLPAIAATKSGFAQAIGAATNMR